MDKQRPCRPQENPERRNVHVSAPAPGQFKDGHDITPESDVQWRRDDRLDANDANHFDFVSKYTGAWATLGD
jgi:hypothetical protein